MEIEYVFNYRYVIFIICGIVGYFGSIAMNEDKNKNLTFLQKISISQFILATIIGFVSSLIAFYFIKDVEICGAVSILTSLTYNQITSELKQIIDKTDQVVDKIVDKKLDSTKEEEEKKE